MLDSLRSKVSAVFNPLFSALASAGISPNAITTAGFLVSILSAYFFYVSQPVYGGIILLLSGFFDILDGGVAKVSGKVTKFGGVLDSTLDRYSDLIIIGAIVIAGLCNPIWGIIAIIGSVMVSYIRAKGELEGVKMAGVGVMERAERILILAVFAIASYTWLGIIILAVLTNFTVAQRLYHIWKELHRQAPVVQGFS
ncbi:MAG: archaetidylinositol phosphate synthase [Candidatus Methanomethylicaceae archaeon]